MCAQVSLPATALQGVFVSSPLAEVTVGPGFSSDQFLIAAPFSTGGISVLGLDAQDLTLLSSGCEGALLAKFPLLPI